MNYKIPLILTVLLIAGCSNNETWNSLEQKIGIWGQTAASGGFTWDTITKQ